jgi:predicted dehydrogenase
MPDKVRIGIIGVGMIGKYHISQYKDMPDVEITAICDLREDEALRVARENGITYVYTDYHEMLKHDEIQSVDVCVHNRQHAELTIAALTAGKNVYCEKPMSWAYCEARSMYDTAKQTGRMLHVQLSSIFAPEARAAKRLIEDGHLGHIYNAKSSTYRRRGRPWVDGYGMKEFVSKTTAGAGATVDTGVYHIARIMWLLGNPEVITVSGSIHQELENMYPDRRASGKYDVEELGMGFVRLAGGITYSFEEAWAINSDKQAGDYVYGSRAGLRIEPLTYFTTLSDMEMDGTFDVKQADWRWHQVNPQTVAYDHSQRHWIAAQLGRVPLLDTAGLALKATKISEGIYLSSHLKREVTSEEIEQTTIDYRLT